MSAHIPRGGICRAKPGGHHNQSPRRCLRGKNRGAISPQRPRPFGPAGGVSAAGRALRTRLTASTACAGAVAAPPPPTRRSVPPTAPIQRRWRAGFPGPAPSPAGPHGTVPGPPPRSSPYVHRVPRPASAPAPPTQAAQSAAGYACQAVGGRGATPVRHFRRGVLLFGARFRPFIWVFRSAPALSLAGPPRACRRSAAVDASLPPRRYSPHPPRARWALPPKPPNLKTPAGAHPAPALWPGENSRKNSVYYGRRSIVFINTVNTIRYLDLFLIRATISSTTSNTEKAPCVQFVFLSAPR